MRLFSPRSICVKSSTKCSPVLWSRSLEDIITGHGPAIEHSDHLALFVAAADPHTMYIFYNQRFNIEFVLQNLFNDNNGYYFSTTQRLHRNDIYSVLV